MTQVKQDALDFANKLAVDVPSLDLVHHIPRQSITDMSIAVRGIKNFDKEKIGAVAQLYTILSSGDRPKEMLFAIRKLVESSLHYEPKSQVVAHNFHSANLPAFSSLTSKLTFRYMLKMLPLSSMAALAATLSWDGCTKHILTSRVHRGTWSEYSSDYGFDISEYIRDAKVEIDSAINQIDPGASIVDACAWYPNGPYSKGYQTSSSVAIANAISPASSVSPAAIADAIQVSAAATHASTYTVNNQGVSTMTTATTAASSINPAVKQIIDGMLTQAGLNISIDDVFKNMDENAKLRTSLTEAEKMAADTINTLQAKLRQQSSAMPSTIQITAASTSVPSGRMEMIDAEKAFPMLKGVNLSLPSFTWDHPHPDVPAVNDDYIFRKGMLISALRCLARGENAWLSGHTGSGKTTFIEQIAARLNWPVARVAFDSNVDRSELVGRMSLKGDGNGGTISEWLPGILERASTGGYILLCDEIDAGHPNALYTLQPLLEGKPLTLLEDGGRVVGRSPMMRIFATGNTTGNGDPSGLYPACRILSAATLDRFQTFIEVPYMTTDEEANLISAAAPGLSKTLVKRLAKFASEMRAAFISGNTPISYSPRRSVAFAREVIDLMDMGFQDESKVLATAFKSKLYDAASEEFRQRLSEIANASLGGGIDPTTANL